MDEYNELWRPVKGFETFYEISNFGRVRSISRIVKVGNTGSRLSEGKLLRPKKSGGSPYFEVTLCNSNEQINKTIHRLVAEAFVVGYGEVVRHLDGNPDNNYPDNLAWGSYKDNEADKLRHNRVPIGERNHNAKLTDGIVREIRKLIDLGFNQSEVARQLGVHRMSVHNIVNKKQWKHVV